MTDVSEVIRQEDGKWFLYSKDGAKKLGGPYDSREEAEDREKEVEMFKHMGECDLPKPSIPAGVYSFSDLDQSRSAQEVQEHTSEVLADFSQMMTNIVWAKPEDLPNKLEAMQGLLSELGSKLPELSSSMAEAATAKSRVRAAMRALDDLLSDRTISDDLRGQVKTMRETFKSRTWADLASDVLASELDVIDLSKVKIQEDSGGSVTLIDEAATQDSSARLDVVFIRPGFGNTRDNNYYSTDMLRENAPKFVGAKMYETDHKAGEKNTRTWVSTVTRLKGFTDDGAPIGEVAIHDPNFAQRVRNLKELGLIEKMECSVLADATAEKGSFEFGGRSGKKIKEIVRVDSIDWVTRAGAGGHAVAISESDMEESMEESTPKSGAPAVLQVEAPPEPVETVESVEESEEIVKLSEVEIRDVIDKSRLPQVSKDRLSSSEYTSLQELETAVSAEVEYVKTLTGSGKPLGLGSSQAPSDGSIRMSEADYTKAYADIAARYGTQSM